MKTLKNIGLLFLATIALSSCSPNEDETTMPAKIQNIEPMNGKSFSADEALQPTTFRWTPLVPKPGQTITYRLKVWQLMQGQNGAQAMRLNQPKITRDIADASQITIAGFYTGPCKPPYLCDFVWSVEAITLNEGSISSTAISNPTVFNF
jgi:hypothetical protein